MIKRTLPYALAQFFMVAFHWMSMLYLPLHFKAAGVSDAGVGVLVSTFSLATLVLIFPLGALSDRLAPRPMMAAGSAVVVIAYLIMPLAESSLAMGAATFLAGAGFALSTISLYSLFFKQVGDDRRGAEVSFFTIGGILGAGFGAAACGFVSESFGDPGALFPLGIVFALAWAAILLAMPKATGIAFPIVEYAKDLRSARTWALIAVMFVTASHAGFEQAGYTLLQTQVIGLSPKTVGNIFLVLSFTMCLTTLAVGRFHDRAGKQPLVWMGVGLIVSGVFMAASGSAQGAGDFLVYRIFHTGGDAVFILLTLVVATIIFPKKRAGGAFAFALTINTASYFLFANIGGLVGGAYGFDRAFHLSGLIEVVGGVALLAFRKPLGRMFELGVRREV